MFTKAKSKPKFIKAMVPAKQKVGKTIFCLTLAELLCKLDERDVSTYVIATEFPNDYAEDFDFNVLETGSINKAIEGIKHVLEQKDCGVLIIDSATEFYKNLIEVWREYVANNGTEKQQKNIKIDKISYYDRGIYNRPWNEFVRLIIESKIHILVTSRKKDNYVKNENDELVIDGEKAQVQKDFEYEFSHVFDLNQKPDLSVFVEYRGRNKNIQTLFDLPDYRQEKSVYMDEFQKVLGPLFKGIGKAVSSHDTKSDIQNDTDKLIEAVNEDLKDEELNFKIQAFNDFIVMKHKKDHDLFKTWFQKTFEKTLPEILTVENPTLKNEIIQSLKQKFLKKYNAKQIKNILGE